MLYQNIEKPAPPASAKKIIYTLLSKKPPEKIAWSMRTATEIGTLPREEDCLAAIFQAWARYGDLYAQRTGKTVMSARLEVPTGYGQIADGILNLLHGKIGEIDTRAVVSMVTEIAREHEIRVLGE